MCECERERGKRQREREKVYVSAFADGWVWDCIYVGGLVGTQKWDGEKKNEENNIVISISLLNSC